MVAIRDILVRIKSEFNNRGTHEARKATERLNQQFKKNEGHFNAWALSVMFFGMLIMRTMQQIWKSSTQTFQDVMHSVEGTTTGFDLLQGSLKYLGFIAGQALEPLAQELIPIVLKIAELIENNEGVFRSFVKWGFIIGSILVVLGQVVLGFNGLVTLVKNVGTAFGFMATKFFKVFPGMQSEIIRSALLWSNMGTAAKIGLLGSVAGIVLALVWIFKLKEAIGSWGGFFKGVLSGLIRALLGFADILVSALLTPIQLAVAGLLQLADALGIRSISGNFGLQEFVKFKPSFLQDFLRKQENSDFWTPEKGWAQGGGLTPTFNVQNLNVTSDNVDEMMQQMVDMSQTGGI